MIRRALSAALLLAVAAPCLAQDNPSVEQVLRRRDRRGIIIMFTTPLQGASLAQDVRNFTLVDLTSKTPVALLGTSVVTPAQCPQSTLLVAGRPVGPRNRLCLELDPAAPALDDRNSYVLMTDTIHLQLPTRAVPPMLLRIGPVGGAVAPIKEEGSNITVNFSRELSGDNSIRPSVKINGIPVAVETSGQTPPCYNIGGLNFQCRLARRFENGNVVEFDLVGPDGRSAGYGPIEKATVTVTAPEKADQVRFVYLGLALSRLQGETNGTLTLKTATDWVVRRFGHVGDPVYLDLVPHADILVTSKTDGSGRLSAGPQLRLNTFVIPGIDLTALQATPRFETDDKNIRQNWMYLDAEAVVYIRPLYRGAFLGAARQLFPRFGYERGTTGRGGDTVLVEARDPSRWTAGASFLLHWEEGAIPIFPAGLDVTADYDRLWIRRDPGYPNPPTARPQYWSAGATFRFSKNLGVTVARRSGRRPPLFKHQSAFEVGASFLY